MILGAILLIVGLVVGIHLLWVIGVVVLAVGLVLMLAATSGRTIGPRRYYW